MESKVGKYFRKKRSSTVEPVIGSLLAFNNMRKILTKGLKQANKTMLCAAVSYNLKKLIKWIIRKEKQAMALTKEAVKNKVTALKISSFNLKQCIIHQSIHYFIHYNEE